MSDVATDLVWSQSKACRGSRLVMLALAREADEYGTAKLSLEEISTLTRLTPRSITKCLAELTRLGELSHERGGGASNPNTYSISRLLRRAATADRSGSGKEVPDPPSQEAGSGIEFREPTPQNSATEAGSRHFQPPESEVSSSRVRGGSTPYGSTTTTTEQASSPRSGRKSTTTRQDMVTIPDGARDLVTALTSAGMLVGWRLTDSEWNRVTALVTRWGVERLVDLVARRWNAERPPQSARYLLRIWADLPSHASEATSQGNVVPLRRQPGGWVPFQNTASASAYQNGF